MWQCILEANGCFYVLKVEVVGYVEMMITSYQATHLQIQGLVIAVTAVEP